MIPGLFGFSLIFELLVLYYAWNIWLTNVDKRWVYFFLVALVLIYSADFSGHSWLEIFNGHFDLFWRGVFSTFGFR
ncbi:MAG: hypothetical protein FJY86_02380 [Candidatus Diapherotrites archaeon]|uniref:Uncharacterized protein n=1 Tax=Candidatus Iainarchaeum sp. TaxID=3101447 RepID=A0A8T4C7J5_9ARCH|nr:hypothetical protein [Candidatus Diapherotrites archaeon]